MSTCLILYFLSIASIAIAMTTPSVPTSTEAMMVPSMQLMSAQTGGNWNGMNGQGRGMSVSEAIQAILKIYNGSIPTGINLPMTGQGGFTQSGTPVSNSRGGRGVGLVTVNWGRRNGGIGFENGRIGGMNSGMEWRNVGVSPMSGVMSDLNRRGMNSGMGWQGGNGGFGTVVPGGIGGMGIGMGGGGRRSNVDKTIRTQATLTSQDEALLRMAGAGCAQDWTYVNGGVDPFCIRLLMMYPSRGM
ncbi:hypothetical protein ACJMK2_007808 [Sinanodonta woodiana]|uniref:Uncharacterized protein n=1 Tax=Sinanodonta woodiana TaxID=1069815 RepID=A0ABD3VMM8_SINWO